MKSSITGGMNTKVDENPQDLPQGEAPVGAEGSTNQGVAQTSKPD